jgi:hypothetical protein
MPGDSWHIEIRQERMDEGEKGNQDQIKEKRKEKRDE